MTRELKHIDGVGNNTRLAVMEDGKKIGVIQRNGNRGFDVFSHYGQKITFGTSLAAAKLRAMEATFPTPQEAYHTACEKAYYRRKAGLEKAFRDKLYALTRAMVAGSNSARHEIAELLAGIDAAANARELPRSPSQLHLRE